MKIENKVNDAKFSDLKPGDVFMHSYITYMVVKVTNIEEDYALTAVDLKSGRLEKFDNELRVIRLPNAVLYIEGF